MLLDEYKKCIRLPKLWGEEDAHYHRRVASCSKEVRAKQKLIDLDGYILGRMFDYVGHVLRAGSRDPQCLPFVVLCHRDKEWCWNHEAIFNHQGHSGRVHPWTYERQFQDYFAKLDLDWKAVANSKPSWNRHRKTWIKSVYGGKCSQLKVW